MGECGEKIYDGKWLWMLLDILWGVQLRVGRYSVVD